MLAFTTRGNGGRAVVALHGFLGSARNLGAMIRAWTARDAAVRVLAPDLLGHGASPPMPEPPSLEALAAGVLRWLDELGEPRVDIVGHSLGGRVALAARARAPERIGRIELLDITPGPIPETDTDRVLSVLLTAPDRADARDPIVEHLRQGGLSAGLVRWLSMNLERGPDGSIAWRIDRHRLADFHHRTRGESLWSWVEARPGGLRWLVGGRSPFVSADDVARLERLGIPIETIPAAGHFVHVDATDAVVDWLVRGPT